LEREAASGGVRMDALTGAADSHGVFHVVVVSDGALLGVDHTPAPRKGALRPATC